MMQWAGIVYCCKCGCWGTVKVRQLSEPCNLTPTKAGAEALRKILSGKAPSKHTTLRSGVGLRPCLVDTC